MAARTAPPADPVAAPPAHSPEPAAAPSPVLSWPSEWPVPVLPEQAAGARKRAARGLPMAPALGAAGNATTLLATGAYAAGGVAGVAATGVVAAAGATAAVVRRRRTVKRNLAARSSGGGKTRSGATSNWGSLGSGSTGGRQLSPRRSGSGGGSTGSASGRSGRSGGSLLGPTGRGSSGGSPKGGGAKSGAGGGRHAAGGGLPGLSKTNKGGSGGKGNGSPKSPTLRAAIARTARAAVAPGSAPRKSLAAVGHGVAGATRKMLGPKSPTVRAAKALGRGAKKAWKADASTSARKTAAARAKRLTGAAHDGIRAVLAGAWAGLRKRDRHAALARLKEVWARRRKKRDNKKTAAPDAPAVAATVRRPASTTAPASTPGAARMSGHHFVAPAMEAARIASAYEPTGMLQVGEDFVGLEEALRLEAEAIKITVEKADAAFPLDPRIVETMRQIHGLKLKAAELAGELRPAFENLHQVDLERLRSPRKGAAGERMWDVTTNLGNH